MSKEKVVQLQDKDGNNIFPKLKHNNYTDEDKRKVKSIRQIFTQKEEPILKDGDQWHRIY